MLHFEGENWLCSFISKYSVLCETFYIIRVNLFRIAKRQIFIFPIGETIFLPLKAKYLIDCDNTKIPLKKRWQPAYCEQVYVIFGLLDVIGDNIKSRCLLRSKLELVLELELELDLKLFCTKTMKLKIFS